MTFFDILSLDLDDISKKSIRRSYSKLLREYPPDTDPVGFRKIYDAYQAALEHLKSGGDRSLSSEIKSFNIRADDSDAVIKEGDHTSDLENSGGLINEIPPDQEAMLERDAKYYQVDEGFNKCLDQIRNEQSSLLDRQLSVLAITSLASQNPEYWIRWQDAIKMMPHESEYADIYAVIPPQFIVEALGNGAREGFCAIIYHLDQHEKYIELVRIANVLSTAIELDENPTLLDEIGPIIFAISLVDPETARELLNKAWELASDFDEQIDDSIELAVSAGEQMLCCSYEQRCLLATWSKSPDLIPDIKKAPASDIVYALVNTDASRDSFARFHLMEVHPNLSLLVEAKSNREACEFIAGVIVFFLLIILAVIGGCTGPHEWGGK